MSLSGYGRPSSQYLALQNLTTGGGSMPILTPLGLADPLPPYGGGRRDGRGQEVTGGGPFGRLFQPAGRKQLLMIGTLSSLPTVRRPAYGSFEGGRAIRGRREGGGGHGREVA